MKLCARRIVALVTSVTMLVLSIYIPRNIISAAYINTNIYYDVYDAGTGISLGSYNLDSVSTVSSNGVSTYNVIGNDTRVVDFTKSGVVKLMTNDGYMGTGFVVDDHTIATAAHCVYNQSTSSVYEISSIRLFDGDGDIEKTVTNLQEIHIPRPYRTFSDSSNYDYALITVGDDLSDYAIFNLGLLMDNYSSSNSAFSITGFPQVVNNTVVNSNTQDTMYTGTGSFYSATDYKIFYNNDTSGGNSGGPVYITTSFNNNVYYSVVGIHTTGGTSNGATRVTTNLLQFFKNNPNAPYLYD